jgi:hypothetical protein
MAADWVPTHVVPAGGLPTWTAPDPTSDSSDTLDAGVEVVLVSEHEGWGEVLCSNGWSCWVDVNQLVALDGAAKGGGLLDQITSNGLLSAIAVLVVGGATSYLLWPVLALPGKALKDAIPRGNCTSETPGSSGMYFCSVRAGFLTALGPLLTIVVAIVFRRPLAAQLQKLTAKLPRNSSMFFTPVLATGMFTMVHAAIHEETADQSGIVPQRMFPALIGLFTFGATRLAPAISRKWGASIDKRDRIPALVRALLALAIPLLSSYALTNQERVTETALKEQSVALLTLFTSYAAFVPRDGDFLGAAQRLLSSRAMRGRAR